MYVYPYLYLYLCVCMYRYRYRLYVCWRAGTRAIHASVSLKGALQLPTKRYK